MFQVTSISYCVLLHPLQISSPFAVWLDIFLLDYLILLCTNASVAFPKITKEISWKWVIQARATRSEKFFFSV